MTSSVTRVASLTVYNLNQTGIARRQEATRFLKAVTGNGGSVLGLDVGTRHIGCALSDAQHRIAFARLGFRRASVRDDVLRIGTLCASANARCAVVGMPIIPDVAKRQTEEGDLQKFVRVYATSMLKECGISHVAFWDESFTSVIARERFLSHCKKSRRNNAALRKREVDAVSCFFLVETITCYF